MDGDAPLGDDSWDDPPPKPAAAAAAVAPPVAVTPVKAGAAATAAASPLTSPPARFGGGGGADSITVREHVEPFTVLLRPTAAGAAVGGAVRGVQHPPAQLPTVAVHRLPCGIAYSGPAKVTAYFQPYRRGEQPPDAAMEPPKGAAAAAAASASGSGATATSTVTVASSSTSSGSSANGGSSSGGAANGDDVVWHCALRGRQLTGHAVSLPDGCGGVVLHDNAHVRVRNPLHAAADVKANGKGKAVRAGSAAAAAMVDDDDGTHDAHVMQRQWSASGRFERVWVWNKDAELHDNDHVRHAITEWIPIARALHKPVTAEQMARHLKLAADSTLAPAAAASV